MAAVSKFEKYRTDIKYLMDINISINSAWKIINYHLPTEAKMSYSAFYHFVKKEIQNTNSENHRL